jgi:hypothetical protein
LTRELLLGETTLSKGGTTTVPEKVVEALNLVAEPGERSKILWTPQGDEVVVTKGTPASDWRKTMVRKNGTTAIPRHAQKALQLRAAANGAEWVLWVRKGNRIVVRKRKRT